MVPKGHRLSREGSSRVDREGFRVSEGPVGGKVLPLPEGLRYVVIAGKAAAKSSVARHSIRRRLSAAFLEAAQKAKFTGDAVIRVRSDLSRTPFEDLVATCAALLRRR